MVNTKVWAHRGASGYVPENTIPAFAKAVDMKADGVELDVQLSKDGELVVIHDETVDRVSDRSGYVKDFTIQELKLMDVSRPVPGYGTARIPTLAEVLEELKPSDMIINIECKTGIFFYPGLEEKMIKLVKDLSMTERIWCSSFNHESVCKVKKMCPEMKTGFLIADVIVDVAEYTKKNGAMALHPALYHMQDRELISRCKKHGLEVHIWTVNDRQDMKELSCAGADAIITNYPDIARNVVDNL
ncbi:MAG: glycerophosphodiester phosphodiesterase [Bacillota bacterium]|nr:glycerophosphodiester phosphodiesterase [Bacillota bacterium]